MNRATPGKCYGEKVAADLAGRRGGRLSHPGARPVPRLKEHKKLKQAYVEFRIGKTRRRVYFGPAGSQAARAKYLAFVRVWPSQLAEDAPRGQWPAVRLITFDGRTQSLAKWAAEVGLKSSTLKHRLDVARWSIEKALTTPKIDPVPPRRRATQHGERQL